MFPFGKTGSESKPASKKGVSLVSVDQNEDNNFGAHITAPPELVDDESGSGETLEDLIPKNPETVNEDADADARDADSIIIIEEERTLNPEPVEYKKKPDAEDVKAAFENNDDIQVEDDGTIWFCPPKDEFDPKRPGCPYDKPAKIPGFMKK